LVTVAGAPALPLAGALLELPPEVLAGVVDDELDELQAEAATAVAASSTPMA
jgi:hypothetical protein